jgi:hypothetical protein
MNTPNLRTCALLLSQYLHAVYLQRLWLFAVISYAQNSLAQLSGASRV